MGNLAKVPAKNLVGFLGKVLGRFRAEFRVGDHFLPRQAAALGMANVPQIPKPECN